MKPLLAPRRRFEAHIPISAPVPGGIQDWPSHIADEILAHIEGIQMREKIELEVTYSGCHHDPDGWHLKIEALESRERGVRLADGRFMTWKDLRD